MKEDDKKEVYISLQPKKKMSDSSVIVVFRFNTFVHYIFSIFHALVFLLLYF